MLGQVNEFCAGADVWATGHPSNRPRGATEHETEQVLTRIVKLNVAEALERVLGSWEKEKEKFTRVGPRGWEMREVVDIVAGLDPRIHLNQSIDDGIAMAALWGRRHIVVFLPDNAQTVLIVKGGAFAAQGLVEVVIDEHAVIGSMHCAKVEVVANVGGLTMVEDEGYILWLRIMSRFEVETTLQAIHDACKGGGVGGRSQREGKILARIRVRWVY